MANEVQVAITIAEKQALKALDNLTDKTKEYTREAEKAAKGSDAAFSKLSATIKGKLALGAVGAAGAAFTAFGVALKKGIDLAQIQEDAINSLNNQLKISGEFTRETSEDLQRYASQLQRTSKFGDEAIISQLAFAKAMGASTEQSKQIVAAAIDMSESLNIDLNSAVRNISKTLGGYSGELSEIIPQLKNLTKEQLQAGEGVKFLSAQFAGAGKGALNTFSGATAQFSNAVGDALEELGKFVTTSEDVIKAVKGLKGSFITARDILKLLRVEAKGFFSTFEEAAKSKDIEVIDGQIDDLNKTIKNAKDTLAGKGFFASFIGVSKGDSDEAKKQIAEANKQIAILQERRKALLKEEETSGPKAIDKKKLTGGGESPEMKRKREEAEKEKMLERQKQIEIQALRDEFDLLNEEKEIAKIEQKAIKNEDEINRIRDFEMAKNAVAFSAAEEKADLIEDAEQRALEKEKAILTRRLADQRAAQKAEMQINQMRVRNQIQTANVLSQVAANFAVAMKEGSKEQAALQAAGAIINTYAGATAALAPPPLGVGPVLGPILATSIIAAGLANVSRIRKQSFFTGGVVGGNFLGTSSGMDTQTANVRTGEMMLNGPQQKRVFDVLNNRDTGTGNDRLIDAINRLASAPMVVEIDGKEVARSVRNARLDGVTI